VTDHVLGVPTGTRTISFWRRVAGTLTVLGMRFLVALVLLLAACNATPSENNAVPTWPVSPEALRPEASGPGEGRPATWALDPRFGPPTAETTELNVLVWDGACSGGAPATGRMSAPAVNYGDATVTVTIWVRPRQAPPGAAFGCPMPEGTPASLRLSQPLRMRTLLDGGHVPPAPPSPANG
jgi:hypothetical protein